MDGNGGKSLLLTEMSPGLDNWRLEAQCSSTHSKSVQPYRRVIDPWTAPEENFGRMTTLFVGGKRVEGQQKETEKENMVVAEFDESSSNKMKAVNAFKFVLIEYIRGVLKPYWKEGNLSRDAYKIILKKSVDKILESIEASKFPKNKSDHQRYLSASKSKIFELVQAYVKKYQKIASILKSACLALRLGLQDPLVTCSRVVSHPIWTSLNFRYSPSSESGMFWWNLMRGPEASDTEISHCEDIWMISDQSHCNRHEDKDTIYLTIVQY